MSSLSPKEKKKSEDGRQKSERENDLPSYKQTSGSDIATSETKHQKPGIEHPTSKINETSEIEHPISEIKKMEVHHHPEVEKKGIKEYLLEGLMIFVAVMMGFFAESLREHINENSRAKEYAVTLYNDLKLDTAELNGYLTYFKYATANTDTLMKLLAASDPKQIPSGKLYWFGLFGGAYHIFTPHDATLSEMKSSGSLRFLETKLLTGSWRCTTRSVKA